MLCSTSCEGNIFSFVFQNSLKLYQKTKKNKKKNKHITNLLTLSCFSIVALRKIDTIHHPSMDKTNQPPEPVLFQKVLQSSDTPPKVPLADRSQPGDIPPKPQHSELPPKPGELPPKPQLSDLPPKPQLGDLPPKPQLKDLPPKPQLTDVSPPKPVTTEILHKPPPGEVAPKPQPPDTPTIIQQGELSPQPVQSSEDTNGSPTSAQETPVPLPRKINPVRIQSQKLQISTWESVTRCF